MQVRGFDRANVQLDKHCLNCSVDEKEHYCNRVERSQRALSLQPSCQALR